MLAFLLLSSQADVAPLYNLVTEREFKIDSEKEGDYSRESEVYRRTSSLVLRSEVRQLRLTLETTESSREPLAEHDSRLEICSQNPYSNSNDSVFGFFDNNPVATVARPGKGSIFLRLRGIQEGASAELEAGSWFVGTGLVTEFSWMPVGTVGRNADWGPEKSKWSVFQGALMRWHHSMLAGSWSFVDNIQRIAGREMVTKVDKDQNVYVDMNELSRHRGWNFSISLEPARADVRIGNDHIKIYPGADRIHINDELVTLPGTVPTQGYGVYLPLRLLQERGYLPSEG